LTHPIWRPASLIAVGLIAFLGGCAISGAPNFADSYNVFFQASDTSLSVEAREVVLRASEAIRSKHPKQVVVAGEPKTVSTPGFDTKFADPRFESVETELIADGMDSNLLARAALTDNEAKVGATGNRRVEIRLYGTQ
jgi:hypothetical protein